MTSPQGYSLGKPIELDSDVAPNASEPPKNVNMPVAQDFAIPSTPEHQTNVTNVESINRQEALQDQTAGELALSADAAHGATIHVSISIETSLMGPKV